MADDEKILRIEAKITEEGKKQSDKPLPSSAGEQLQENELLAQETKDRTQYESLQQEKNHQDNLEKIIKDIGTKEDTPLPTTSPPGQPSSSLPPSPSISPPGTAQGGGASPVVPPINPAGSGVGAAGAAGAGVGSFLSSLAVPAGLLAIELTVLGTAVVGLTGLFVSAFELLNRQFEELSPQIAQARAQQSIELTMEKLRKAQDVGDESSRIISGETDFYKEFIDLSEKLINLLGPALEFLLEVSSDILSVLNGLLEVVKFISIPVKGAFKTLTEILRFFRKSVEPDEPTDEKFIKEANALFGNTMQVHPLGDGRFNLIPPQKQPEINP